MQCLFFLEYVLKGCEETSWAILAEFFVLCRVCQPSSKSHVAYHSFEQLALADVSGIRGGIREESPVVCKVFEGNRTDVTRAGKMIDLTQGRCVKRTGRARWMMDRGIVSQENMGLLTKKGRRDIQDTHRGQLNKHEGELLKAGGLEVQGEVGGKWVDNPDGKKIFILCRSQDQAEKDKTIHDRFERWIEDSHSVDADLGRASVSG